MRHLLSHAAPLDSTPFSVAHPLLFLDVASVPFQKTAFPPSPDPYKLMGLPRNASEALIRARYRYLCKRWHPDRNASQDTTAQFQLIQSAYKALELQ